MFTTKKYMKISWILTGYHLKTKNSLKRDYMQNIIQACLSQILKISISFIKWCLKENFKIHLILQKLILLHTISSCLIVFIYWSSSCLWMSDCVSCYGRHLKLTYINGCKMRCLWINPLWIKSQKTKWQYENDSWQNDFMKWLFMKWSWRNDSWQNDSWQNDSWQNDFWQNDSKFS